MTSPLERALSGDLGQDAQKVAEDSIKGAVDKLADMLGTGRAAGAPVNGFASGGVVKNPGPFIVGNGDREHFVPIGFIPTPAPTRIVEYHGTPARAPVRVKGVIDATVSDD